MFPSRFLVGREGIIFVVCVVSFADLVGGERSLLCLKFLPSVKRSSWDKANNTKNKQARAKCAIPKTQKRVSKEIEDLELDTEEARYALKLYIAKYSVYMFTSHV